MAEKQPRSLLTIEDDATIRRILRGYFEEIGFEVFEADNGDNGLSVFRGLSCDPPCPCRGSPK